ncbi:MAG: universal stress protein [Vicinamibacteraceae bacterium]
MSRFQKILAAVDFSDSTPDALDAALALATVDASSHIHLLHVVPSPVPPLWTDEMPPLDLQAIEQSLTDSALKQLATLAVSRALDPASVTSAVVVGPAAHEIVLYAEAHGVDVIVLGSHGHGLVRRFLLGSVADKIVRQAPCAVLVVPHQTLRGGSALPPASSTPAIP